MRHLCNYIILLIGSVWRSNSVINQSIPLRSTLFPSESVMYTLISEIVFELTGQYNSLFGSKVNGKLLVRLSVGITAIVFVFSPFTTDSFIAVVFMFKESIDFVTLGRRVPYSVLVTSFFSNPMRFDLDLFHADQVDNHHQVIPVLDTYSE